VNRAGIRAMLAGLPPGLTPAERLILTVLALHAGDDGQSWPGPGLLCAETGLSERGLQDALARLARRGLEVRVPLAPGAEGRGAFAGPGRRRRFRLPEKLQVTSEPAGQNIRSRHDVTKSPDQAKHKPAGQSDMVTPRRDRMVTPQRDLKTEQQKVFGGQPPDPPPGTGARTAAGDGSPDPPSPGKAPGDGATGYQDHPIPTSPVVAEPPAPRRTGTGPAARTDRDHQDQDVKADPAGAGLDSDRVPRERTRAGDACARPDCGQPVTGRQRYCSARCRKSEENRRRAERKNGRPATADGQARTVAALAARAARRLTAQASQ
jgi:hypothetical protein